MASLLLFSCGNKKTEVNERYGQTDIAVDVKTVHVFVALCDNRYQGITRVPAALGNGQNVNTNLYWGALYGVRSYFRKSDEWEFVTSRKSQAKKSFILERLVFKHKEKDFYLIADAYNGRYIKQCTLDFLNSVCGNEKGILRVDGKTLGLGGNASLLAYVGHDGLMDFQLSGTFINTDEIKRDVIILACYSKRFFGPHLENANINHLLWTTNLMAPEAYTLHDAVSGYINGETNEEIRERASAAYSKYQKCGINAAKGLLVTD